MNLEQQVCSLDLAKRLKELGVKQDSKYWYDSNHKLYLLLEGEIIDCSQQVIIRKSAFTSAFTVAELLQMLKEPVLVPVDGSAADYLADLIIKQHENGDKRLSYGKDVSES